MKRTSEILVAVFLSFSILVLSHTVFAQGKQAVVLMRTGSSSGASCDGTAEINYQTIVDLRLNNEGDIRLFNSSASDGLRISRKDYEDAAKNKLANMYQLKWQDGFLYALSGNGQTPLLVLPEEMKPQKNTETAMNSFYSVMFSGEARDGKQKRKVSLAMRDIWKIYFIPEGGNVNEVLYNYAVEEKSVVIWEAFLRKTNNYRLEDANSTMRGVLLGCVQSSIDKFLDGDYKSLEVAKQRIERAQTIKIDEATNKLLLEIGQHKKRVSDAREQVYQLIGANRWDDAINAAEPIKIYLSSWEDLNSFYNKALDESHKMHLAKGKQALEANQLDAAKTECTIARQRIPGSNEALGCFCLAGNRIALRDSGLFRQRKQPQQAKKLLETQLAESDCSRDEAVLKELGVAKCEYSQQLFEESKKLTMGGAVVAAKTAKSGRTQTQSAAGLKQVTAQNKKDFRDAREKLLFAGEMCPAEGAQALLAKVNQSLSAYSIAEANKATQRGDFGTAYVYLVSAQNYMPGSENVSMQLNRARTQFEEKTRVNIGVVFANKAGYGSLESILNDITGEVESVATRVGLEQPVILDRNQAASAWRTIQNGGNLSSPTAMFSGDLLDFSVSVNPTRQAVRSYYEVPNPEWKQRDVIHDNAVDVYKACKKQYGEAACVNQENEMKRLKRYRDSVNSNLRYDYTYYETYYRVSGSARMTFRYSDSISRSARTAETLTAAVADQCVARSGVDSRDRTASNTECSQIRDESSYVEKMSSQLRSNASGLASNILRDLPMNYYRRAKSSANRPQAVEDYLRFLFLTSDKSGAEAEDAKKFLAAFDSELKTDGVLR